MRRLLLLAPAALLALTACASSSTGSSGGSTAGPQTGSRSGGSIKPVTVPVLSGDLVGGGQLSTASYAGQVTVINFYASWCAPCTAETPYLESLATANPAVRFVGVLSQDSETNGEAFRATYHVTYPSLVDSSGSDVAKFRSLSPAGLPVTFVVDRQGKIVDRYIGGVTATSDLQAVLTRLQAG